MRRKQNSLAKRLSRGIVNQVSVVFLIAIIAVAVVSGVTLTKDAKQNALRALDNSILEIEKALTGIEASTNEVSWLIQYTKGDRIEAIMNAMLRADTTMSACAVAFAPFAGPSGCEYEMYLSSRDTISGRISSTVLGGEDYDYQTMDWYQLPNLLGKPVWNDPCLDSKAGTGMVAIYSVPLYDEYGIFFGVLRSDMPLGWLSDVIDKFRPYESALTLLVGRNGTYIAHRDKEKILNETIYTDGIGRGNEKEMEICREVMSGRRGSISIPLGGKMVHSVYAPMKNGWTAIGMCGYSDFFSASVHINRILLIVALLGILALYFACKRKVSRMTQPITEFTYAAMNMSRGNFHATIPTVHSEDEIKALHDSLSYMQGTFNRYIDELKSTTSSKERIQSELNIASAIQLTMLPHEYPKSEEFGLYASMTPAKEVGGDMYDFFISGRDLYIAIGDVSGKGVPAAIFMAITRASFRLISSLGASISGIASKINDTFSDGNESGMFVTLFLAKVNLDTLEMEYCNAGHNPIVIAGQDGSARFLKAIPNIAAGLFPGFEYTQEKMTLSKGDRILLYTDGVTEAETASKDQYGEDRLIKYMGSLKEPISSKEVVEGLIGDIHAFTGGAEQNDDITILTLHLR